MTDGAVAREQAERLDAQDPLAGLRDRFLIADPHLVYLDGNSLGRLPAATPDHVDAVVRQQWGEGLVRSWEHWIDLATRLGDRLAEHVLGALPGEVTVADSTSVNLYKLAAAALDARPGRGTIVLDTDDFPTDRYIVRGLAEARRHRVRTVTAHQDQGLDLERLRSALDHDVALVVLSLVSYRSGALLDMAAVNDLARRAGALVLWDLSHAAGAIPIALDATGADLAVGCTYKYLNGGPGAPAFLYVRRGLHGTLRQPIWGWFGQREQFRMGPHYDPAAGIERFLSGTPPVLSLACLDPALAVVEEAGVERLRAKGMLLGELVVDLARQWLVPLGFRLASPASARDRGSHVSLAHPDAWRICRALAQDADVICDFRVPDRLRIGPCAAYTRFVDVWDALDRLRELVTRGEYLRLPAELARVT